MSRVPNFNREAFDSAAALLRADGWEVYNPVEKDIEIYGEALFDNPLGDIDHAKERYGFNYRRAMHDCLSWLCAEADAIYLLHGWQLSYGARAENACAQALKLVTFTAAYYPIPYGTNTFQEAE